MVDHAALAGVLDDFTATVSGPFLVEDLLTGLAQAAVRVLGVDGAGVMSPRDGRLLRFVAATSAPVTNMGRLQEVLQEGPCGTAYTGGRVVNIADLAVEGDWPAYQTRAVQLGLRAVAAVPLSARGRTWGVLDVYRARPGRFDDAEIAAVQTLANLAATYLVVTADRDTARRAQEELAHHAMHDQLTGLPVRWVFLEQLTHALGRLTRHPGHLAVLFCDLDGLKYVNDTYGHTAGDALIRTCVERIRAALRPTDLLARIGGDEFVVLLEDLTGPADAGVVAGRVSEALTGRHRRNDPPVAPSVSIGAATTADPAMTADTLIARADAAMYRAKQTGPGRYEIFDPAVYAADRAAVTARDELTVALRAALGHGDLELHYQPIIDLTAGTELPTAGQDATGEAEAPGGVWAVEALARWRHPVRGLLTAAQFIDVAERSGLILDLGAWALRTACTQLADWDDQLGGRSPARLFVNISVAELAQPTLPQFVVDTLHAAHLDPARLTLEITETGLSAHPGTAETAVRALRDVGCDVAIDDFGTGYSSLNRLVHIPAATLKVDQTFTRDLTASPDAAAVITAVLQLGRTLHRTVIIEGVEDAATLHTLRTLGATHAQGFHLAHPQPPDTLSTTL